MLLGLVKGRRGVSLLEVLVGLAIFSTVFVILLSLFPVGADSVRLARETNLGSHLAEELLEQIQAQDFDNVTSTAFPAEQIPITTVNNDESSTLTFERQALITNEPAESPEIKNVVVSVTWTSDSVLHSLRLETDLVRRTP